MRFIKLRLAIFLFILLSAGGSFFLFEFDSLQQVIIFSVTVTSLVVSLVAFFISLQTYLSIDSVNKITQMDGNVLENEGYITNLTCLLKEYDLKDASLVEQELFKNLEVRFSEKSNTVLKFASHLQYFIDLLVFFPSLFNNSVNKQRTKERMDKLLTLIEKKKDLFCAMSSGGNLILIEETIKLIRCVLTYQQLINHKVLNIASSLLEVRGTMLKNSVTQTVYYNYLGLYYNKKAMFILQTYLNLEKVDLLELKHLTLIVDQINHLNEQENELFIMYLLEAKKAFSHALQSCQDDLMWEGFIKYNEARTSYYLDLLNFDDGKNWHNTLNEAIIARYRLNLLIKEIFINQDVTHLQQHFIYQEYLARLIKMNLQIASKQDITNTRNKVIYPYPNYEGLREDYFVITPYKQEEDRIHHYQRDLKQFVSEQNKLE